MGYSFLVEYNKGKENKVANALSRRFEASEASTSDSLSEIEPYHAQLYLISCPCPTWLDVLKDGYGINSEYQKLFSDLAAPNPTLPHFSLQNGNLLYKGEVFLSSGSPLKPIGPSACS